MLIFAVTLPLHLLLDLPSVLFPSGLYIKTACVHVCSLLQVLHVPPISLTLI